LKSKGGKHEDVDYVKEMKDIVKTRRDFKNFLDPNKDDVCSEPVVSQNLDKFDKFKIAEKRH